MKHYKSSHLEQVRRDAKVQKYRDRIQEMVLKFVTINNNRVMSQSVRDLKYSCLLEQLNAIRSECRKVTFSDICIKSIVSEIRDS